MTARANLKDVTICAADGLNPELAGRALARSALQCEFADSILFTDRMVEGPFRRVAIPPLRSRLDYSRFILRELHHHIATPFALVVQWDGYVLDGGCWDPAFLAYDYIGATWPWHPSLRVGNGGFSLRSRRLLTLTADLPETGEMPNEDERICRVFRPLLEQKHGVVFAPEDIADAFSYERGIPDRPTFGFHGMFNMWRFMSDEEIAEIAEKLDDRSISGSDFVECVCIYWVQRRFSPLAALYGRWRKTMTVEQVGGLVRPVLMTADRTAAFLKQCEATLAA
jgi:hypothetical protein